MYQRNIKIHNMSTEDLDLDEQGIYREKDLPPGEGGILIDNDGIWIDDADRLSHYTFKTDSGLGGDYAEGKRSFVEDLNDEVQESSCSVQTIQPNDGKDMSVYLQKTAPPDSSGTEVATQERTFKAVDQQGHSLIEFEELEKHLMSDVDERDLIGQYLRDLETRQKDEDIEPLELPNEITSQDIRDNAKMVAAMLDRLTTSESETEKSIKSPRRQLPTKPRSRPSSGSRIPIRSRSPSVKKATPRSLPIAPGKADSTQSDDERSRLKTNTTKVASRPPSVPSTLRMKTNPSSSNAKQPSTVNNKLLLLTGGSSMDESDGPEQSARSDKSKRELTKRLQRELFEKEKKDLTINQLQQELHTLYKKHAEAENVIDELKIGAKVTLDIATPAGQVPQPNNVPGPQHAQFISMSTPAVGQQAVIQRPGSARKLGGSQASLGIQASTSSNPGRPIEDNFVRQREDSVVKDDIFRRRRNSSIQSNPENLLSELASKVRSIQDQTESFNILLDQEQLNIDEQQDTLSNIRQKHDDLQNQYTNLKSETLRRDEDFDPDSEVAGELHKLNLKLDDLEGAVNNNVRLKANERQPFKKNAMKASHSVASGEGSLGGPQSGYLANRKRPEVLPSVGTIQTGRRKSSLGSIGVNAEAGGGEVDDMIDRVNEEYGNLMDKYRNLKAMSKNPSRNAEVDHLMQQLRNIYDKAPEQLNLVPPEEVAERPLLKPASSVSSSNPPGLTQSDLEFRHRETSSLASISTAAGRRRFTPDHGSGKFPPIPGDSGIGTTTASSMTGQKQRLGTAINQSHSQGRKSTNSKRGDRPPSRRSLNIEQTSSDSDDMRRPPRRSPAVRPQSDSLRGSQRSQRIKTNPTPTDSEIGIYNEANRNDAELKQLQKEVIDLKEQLNQRGSSKSTPVARQPQPVPHFDLHRVAPSQPEPVRPAPQQPYAPYSQYWQPGQTWNVQPLYEAAVPQPEIQSATIETRGDHPSEVYDPRYPDNFDYRQRRQRQYERSKRNRRHLEPNEEVYLERGPAADHRNDWEYPEDDYPDSPSYYQQISQRQLQRNYPQYNPQFDESLRTGQPYSAYGESHRYGGNHYPNQPIYTHGPGPSYDQNQGYSQNVNDGSVNKGVPHSNNNQQYANQQNSNWDASVPPNWAPSNNANGYNGNGNNNQIPIFLQQNSNKIAQLQNGNPNPSIFVPAKIEEAPKRVARKSKIRYYIREYDDSEDNEKKNHKHHHRHHHHHHHKHRHRHDKTRSRSSSAHAKDDSDRKCKYSTSEDEKSDNLNKVLERAKALKKLSGKVKDTLSEDLERSFQESFLHDYL